MIFEEFDRGEYDKIALYCVDPGEVAKL